jgi:transcriptional regulator with AAA-type ATPase domain
VFLDEIGDLALELKQNSCAFCRNVSSSGSAEPLRSLWIYESSRRPAVIWRLRSRRGYFAKTSTTGCDVIALTLPPLRERKEDIPALAAYFLRAIRE